ncbi:MAG: hypothetical protein ABIT76_04895 [Chthoniobacterales bacterium]
MRVLITNTSLHRRGGSQTFVRDLARDLQNLGHVVMAYTSSLKEGERLLESDVVPVTTDLANLPMPPDIIHAQHHLEAMTALTALPGVPAIYHCHGAVWRECVPKHPRIYRYLAMSRTLAERMTIESNIDPSDVDVFLNGVNPRLFPNIRQLPETPRRAIFYSRVHDADSATVHAAKAATAAAGIELDLIGQRFGNYIYDPEIVLPTYDVVFASGRSAIEALACGCAVVILGQTSCGEMVTPENFDRFREVNFSIAVNSAPPSAEEITRELQRYSPTRCREVTARLRTEADCRKSIDSLVEIYEQVIARHQAREPDHCEEILAISRYLRRLVPLIKSTDELQKNDGLPASPASAALELQAQLTWVMEQFAQPR